MHWDERVGTAQAAEGLDFRQAVPQAVPPMRRAGVTDLVFGNLEKELLYIDTRPE